jgi:hypothetical protein
MNFKAPSLTTGKRASLQRTKEWLTDLLTDLESKKSRLDELNTALDAAESSKQQLEKDAALSPDAALKLAGVEAQLSRLAPEVEQLHESLERDTYTALHQVNLVRSQDVRELLVGPLIEQVVSSLASDLSRSFGPEATQYAKQIMDRSIQYRQVMFYLNRPPIGMAEFEDAKREINAMVGELRRILAGQTLIEA